MNQIDKNKSSSDLEQWLERIQAMHPEEIELGLERIRPIAQQLNLLKPAPICVLVAGTNGKGSTAALMQSLLMEQGKSVGLYSSPHLLRFNERIKCNTDEISNSCLCECFEQIEVARGNIPLTYFEFTTLAALLHFKQQNLDICLLEIGMGGRLDAVNLVDADVCVITSIGLDHQAWLGESLDVIAKEKAAIARANKPLICGQKNPPKTVRQVCEKQEAVLYQVGIDFGLENQENQLLCWLDKNKIHTFELSDSIVVKDNIATALQALNLLNLMPTQTQLNRVLANLKLAGRMQSFRVQLEDKQFKVTLDVAHNVQAAQMLSKRLGKMDGIIVAMLKDKQVKEVVAALPDAPLWLLPELDASVDRKINSSELSAYIEAENQCFANMAEALETMLKQAKPNQHWLIVGSFYTIEAGLKFIHLTANQTNRQVAWNPI